jgi:hypothetical protein
MKLKYNIGNKILYLILLSVVIVIMLVQGSSAVLLTSSANPTSIFKCGESTISATFSDGGIVSVNAIFNPTDAVNPMIPGSGRNIPEMAAPINISLANNGTTWVGTFGDNPTMLWGTRSITYLINGVISYPSSSQVFVYNSAGTCVGTGKNSYQNYTQGIGNNTNRLVTGDMDLITWSLYGWIQLWGYMFYMVVMFIVVSVIYLKSQNVMPTIYAAISFLLVISLTGAIPITFRSTIVAFIGLCIGAMLYRFYTRD